MNRTTNSTKLDELQNICNQISTELQDIKAKCEDVKNNLNTIIQDMQRDSKINYLSQILLFVGTIFFTISAGFILYINEIPAIKIVMIVGMVLLAMSVFLNLFKIKRRKK